MLGSELPDSDLKYSGVEAYVYPKGKYYFKGIKNRRYLLAEKVVVDISFFISMSVRRLVGIASNVRYILLKNPTYETNFLALLVSADVKHLTNEDYKRLKQKFLLEGLVSVMAIYV